ncbi:MAG TPA: hypothetical protein VFP60_05740 [Pseudolabrys sp.]|nr:hypothetical protein [Pseudolabrys sp.]
MKLHTHEITRTRVPRRSSETVADNDKRNWGLWFPKLQSMERFGHIAAFASDISGIDDGN